jgi:hypothetical protein
MAQLQAYSVHGPGEGRAVTATADAGVVSEKRYILLVQYVDVVIDIVVDMIS